MRNTSVLFEEKGTLKTSNSLLKFLFYEDVPVFNVIFRQTRIYSYYFPHSAFKRQILDLDFFAETSTNSEEEDVTKLFY